MKIINKISQRFCSSAAKDHIYEFDRSSISLSVRLNNLKDFQDFERLKQLQIHRIIYNLKNESEMMNVLSEHNDEQLKRLLDPNFFIFRGINFNVNTVIRDNKIRKIESKALLQVCQHLFKLKADLNKSQFQIFLNVDHQGKIDNEQEFLVDLKEHLDDLESIVENSFNFELNYVLNWNQHFSFDFLFKMINQQQTLRSVDFNIFKYANPKSSELDQNREILATYYQNATGLYNTLFMKNFTYDNEYISSQDLNEGVVSYSHFVDMLKLMHFRGTLVLDYNKYIEKNKNFVDQLLSTNKYILQEKNKLDESHEAHLVEDDTPPLDV